MLEKSIMMDHFVIYKLHENFFVLFSFGGINYC